MASATGWLWTAPLVFLTITAWTTALPAGEKTCPRIDCNGEGCRTLLDPDGCLVCECGSRCPLLVCGPHCHQQTDPPEGRCPQCICDEQSDGPSGRDEGESRIRCTPPLCENQDCVHVVGDQGCLVCRCDLQCPPCGAGCRAENGSGPGHCPRCICRGDGDLHLECSPPQCDGSGCRLITGQHGCPKCQCNRKCIDCTPGCVRTGAVESGGCPRCECQEQPRLECLPPRCEGVDCRLAPGDDGCLQCHCDSNCTACPQGCVPDGLPQQGSCPNCVCVGPHGAVQGVRDQNTSVQCTPPKCHGPNCRLVDGGHGCQTCSCAPECPVLQCAPGCHPEEHTHHGLCPRCVCKGGTVEEPDDESCFTPLLRKTLRRLAELETRLTEMRHTVDHHSLRLERLSHMHMERPHQPHHDSNYTEGSHHSRPQGDHGAHYHHYGHHHHHHHHPHHHHHHEHVHEHSNHLGADHSSLRERHAEAFSEPRLSETEYDFAICKMSPNTALSEHEQQPVHGLISLWQQTGSDVLNVLVQLTGFKTPHRNRIGSRFSDHRAYMHGLHVHAYGNLTDSCQSTGPHFNPTGMQHGDRRSTARHVGDFGNVVCDKHGETNVIFTDTVASLRGEHSIIGRSINVHARMDDLGRNPDIPASLSSGNAGSRVACCVIEKVSKLPQLNTRTAKRILREIVEPFEEIGE